MPVVTVTHRTTYRYAAPVELGDHQLMLRPRGGRGVRVIEADLHVNPRPRLSWGHDQFGNVVETARFEGAVTELSFVSRFTVEHSPRHVAEIAAAAGPRQAARPVGNFPSLARGRPDPDRLVDSFAEAVVHASRGGSSFDLMAGMTSLINAEFSYARRDAQGTQDPVETLRSGSGSCRDFAMLMVDAARSLGMPARFVSGYIYEDPATSGGDEAMVGGGSTHAWAQVHLPGAGWVDFDPTNDLVGGRNLIASALTLDPTQCVPLSGAFRGYRSDFLGMDVDVSTVSRADADQPSIQEKTSPDLAMA